MSDKDHNPDPSSPKLEKVRIGGGKCPTCGEPVVARYRPFCSKRCADVDLGRWFNEKYRLPTEEWIDPDEYPAEN